MKSANLQAGWGARHLKVTLTPGVTIAAGWAPSHGLGYEARGTEETEKFSKDKVKTFDHFNILKLCMKKDI